MLELRNVCKQTSCSKIHRKFPSEKQRYIRSFTCKRCLDYTSRDKLHRNRYAAFRHKIFLGKFLDDLCLIASERYPNLDRLLAGNIGKRSIVLKERAYECVPAKLYRFCELFLTACELSISRGKFYVIYLKRLIAVIAHPC